MVNTEKFIERLQKIMKFHGLSASAFADRVGVQRSSISHILSGRNKPSLEFVMKVLSTFRDVDLYWLLNGNGNFPSETKTETISESNQILRSLDDQSNESSNAIERIVIFYKDGSFKNFEN